MVAAYLGQREGLGIAYVRVADDRQVIPKRLERTQAARGEVERTAFGRRRPQVLFYPVFGAAGRTVDHFDAHQASRVSCRLAKRAPGRHHGFEQRQ